MSMFKKTTGFTFIELLVVVTIIGVLIASAVVSYTRISLQSRDARRKRDLGALQAALEVYKQTNGAYPASSGCSGGVTWPGCASPWITGLTSTYISDMPIDPKNTANSAIGNSSSGYTYNYRLVNATTYHLITRLERTTDPTINGSSYGYSGTAIYVVASPR